MQERAKKARHGLPVADIGRGAMSAWLSTRSIILLSLLFCLPFLLVEIPPLVDMPGHIGAAAIEAAPAGSPLSHYYHWNWALTLNMGGEVLMKLLAAPFGVLAAGWCCAVLATGGLVAGMLTTIRSLNPRSPHGLGWALMFVFSFPWLWGFLNYILAVGLGLLLFAASLRLEGRPALRSIVLLMGQPLLLLCHAIGGLLLPILIATTALGTELDLWARRSQAGDGWTLAAMQRLFRACWPLLSSVAVVILWKIYAPAPPGPGMIWNWHVKQTFLFEVLRDQSFALDIICTALSYAIILLGWLAGARWRWRQGLPALAILLLYIAMPARINGSEAVDTRLLPVAAMLALGLQDWSGASVYARRAIALCGAALLAIRLAVLAASFATYANAYRAEFGALAHVRPGSRIFVLAQNNCKATGWRLPRTDMLPALASLYREVWINDHWFIPGLDMLQSRLPFSGHGPIDLSPMVSDARCTGPGRRTLAAALPSVPLQDVDYLWLVETGLPRHMDPRLKILWRYRESALFAVRKMSGSAAR